VYTVSVGIVALVKDLSILVFNGRLVVICHRCWRVRRAKRRGRGSSPKAVRGVVIRSIDWGNWTAEAQKLHRSKKVFEGRIIGQWVSL
jgi:hypothetical protein